jgi:predicted methyltransferase
MEEEQARYPPGRVRDAILQVMSVSGCPLSVKEIGERVCHMIGETPTSSIRSYLRLNTPSVFTREGRGRYAVRTTLAGSIVRDRSETPQWREPFRFGKAVLYHADCFEWLERLADNSIHAVVTDPPYGLHEYTPEQQAFLRKIVRAVLPLGKGVVLDPFAGAGSTLAAAEAVGYDSIGVEKDEHFFDMACKAIPRLTVFTS